ncbi:MAG: acetylxylan esterase [Lentisphaeria bacterium]|nr:acetylxylan esterase [Lentisphaeria bacterium]
MKHQFASENLPPEIQEIADRMNIELDQVPPYELPALPIPPGTSAADFLNRVRPELVRIMRENMYGPIPPRCEELIFRKRSEGPAFDGLAVRREIDIVCRNRGLEHVLHLLLYLPAERHGKVPVFFGLNFKGNHTTTDDPGVTFHPFTRYPASWTVRFNDTREDESGRGKFAGRWCFEKALRAGFASATIGFYDIFPDRRDGFRDSVMRLFRDQSEWDSPDRDFGAISAWAWGIMRAIDCLEAQDEIDRDRIIVHGHSRLGKTALWAGANDPRIALTVSNGSGTCGAKPARRYYGENFEWIQLWNPHWLPAKFQQTAGKDREIPFDQHFLMAAIAPRLLYVSDGTDDVYADPVGSFEAVRAASEAWRVFGGTGLGETVQPPPGKLIGREIGYYLREGGHAFTPENWDALIRFASSKLQ